MNYIGVDPSFRDGGIGICVIEGESCYFVSVKNFLAFTKWLSEEAPEGFYCIENSNLQKESFDKKGGLHVACRKARNAGMNMAVSQLTVDFCVGRFGVDMVFEITPQQKGAKILDLKVFEAIVRQEKVTEMLGYKGLKAEQDKRDAFMIALKGKGYMKLKEKSIRNLNNNR